jgi:zinc transport system ATP-binding protein
MHRHDNPHDHSGHAHHEHAPQADSASAPAGPLAIRVRDARVNLGGLAILRGVNLEVPAGRIVALIGPNGSGKTTLLRALLGLQKISSGEISLFGEKDLKKALPRVGYVPQRLNLERSFSLSVREFLSLRLGSTRHWFWQTRQRNDDLIRGSLAEIGVESLLEKPLATLSGGQLQRVLIAFSLLCKPELLLLDEPTRGCAGRGHVLRSYCRHPEAASPHRRARLARPVDGLSPRGLGLRAQRRHLLRRAAG